MKRLLCLPVLIWALFVLTGCSGDLAQAVEPEQRDRFSPAEKHDQFVPVNRSVDCKGTKVTIEKILMDKPNTFMIALVDGDIRGKMDSLHADLFDDQNRNLGRTTFSQKLPGGKTLLTFNAVENAPQSLRMEFFGGPVGYGGHVVLSLDDIIFKTVDTKYTQEYRLAETIEKNGYKLTVESIVAGISETAVRYKLSSLGNFDGIDHGWLYDWNNNYSPEGEILSMFDSGRRLGVHLSSLNCLGPYYRVSQNKKIMAGRANFDSFETNSLQLKLTDVYGYYNMNEIISIDGVEDRLDINKNISVSDYTVYLKSFSKAEDGERWILDYDVLDPSGNKADAAIEAGIYMKADNYRMPMTLFNKFNNPAGGDRRLVIPWQPPADEKSVIYGPAIKITRMGIRLEDTVLNIDLENPPRENTL